MIYVYIWFIADIERQTNEKFENNIENKKNYDQFEQIVRCCSLWAVQWTIYRNWNKLFSILGIRTKEIQQSFMIVYDFFFIGFNRRVIVERKNVSETRRTNEKI